MEEEGREAEGTSSQNDLTHNQDLRLTLQESQCSEEPGSEEEVIVVDKEAVAKLTEGLLSHYLPDLQTSKQVLQELTQNQVILLDTLDQEVTKFRECNALLDLNSLFSEAKVYHNKLVNIRKEMMMIHEKTTKLKKRALKLQQQKQKEALEKEQQREKELERERQLIAKPAKRT
ncbi:biogenesis of lysosome-related organelles complex 1 subunit 6 [Myripristis murdjan]|uniref:Biogenesis of lysosome-related organelles complex 1 subunit 6 n=1 Tax=Myripristis murdjan TaxID=586833 RepID=A0A667YEU1_9TELE|nr:biogenesis of lysosome-related organelles complex 1 subunit 6 [Myripristis murdjan]XP_029904254.1 biogenesis of lysosome-related organelles complex 1 subunit 6 [Myripristis murdjan]XP_029904255.1 biogenesis of lysosome-related organelles complex 1 subunit 6 [Myripristis murdjan]